MVAAVAMVPLHVLRYHVHLATLCGAQLHPAVPCNAHSALICHELLQRTATNYYFFLFLLSPLFILTPTGRQTPPTKSLGLTEVSAYKEVFSRHCRTVACSGGNH
ncbi:hypothetical protein FQN60_018160 [Etheostoma spectabile]|uniref:Uncharacterized protein n=1 Tax=Etheostoma spectabile TaxID=54343 RepID=A0A5J5DH70_9PERO|nr:hypothetical protein FQN60_018160 [Etheostoma spectabile]